MRNALQWTQYIHCVDFQYILGTLSELARTMLDEIKQLIQIGKTVSLSFYDVLVGAQNGYIVDMNFIIWVHMQPGEIIQKKQP